MESKEKQCEAQKKQHTIKGMPKKEYMKKYREENAEYCRNLVRNWYQRKKLADPTFHPNTSRGRPKKIK